MKTDLLQGDPFEEQIINDNIDGVPEEQLSQWRNEYRRVNNVFLVCFILSFPAAFLGIITGLASMLGTALSLGLSAELGISAFFVLILSLALAVLVGLSETKVRKYTVACCIYLVFYMTVMLALMVFCAALGLIALCAQCFLLTRYKQIDRLSKLPGYPFFNGTFYAKQYTARLYSDEQITKKSAENKNTYMDDITEDDILKLGDISVHTPERRKISMDEII